MNTYRFAYLKHGDGAAPTFERVTIDAANMALRYGSAVIRPEWRSYPDAIDMLSARRVDTCDLHLTCEMCNDVATFVDYVGRLPYCRACTVEVGMRVLPASDSIREDEIHAWLTCASDRALIDSLKAA